MPMQLDNVDLSFIIPCHNLENYIKPLLLSFHALDLTDITTEFIFVLDSCSDKTEEVIKTYMDDFDYKIISCNEHSCGIARNLGFNLASGTYIWFVDGDDWIINPAVVKDCLYYLKELDLPIVQLEFTSNSYTTKFWSMVWQYIFKRDFIKDIKFPSIQPAEDEYFMKKVFTALESNEVVLYQAPSYYYNYKRPGSNMTQYNSTGKIQD